MRRRPHRSIAPGTPLSCDRRSPAHPPWPPLHKGGKEKAPPEFAQRARKETNCGAFPRRSPAHPPWPPLHKGGKERRAPRNLRNELGRKPTVVHSHVALRPTPPGPPFTGGREGKEESAPAESPAHPPWPPLHKGEGEARPRNLRSELGRKPTVVHSHVALRPTPPGPPFTRGIGPRTGRSDATKTG